MCPAFVSASLANTSDPTVCPNSEYSNFGARSFRARSSFVSGNSGRNIFNLNSKVAFASSITIDTCLCRLIVLQLADDVNRTHVN